MHLWRCVDRQAGRQVRPDKQVCFEGSGALLQKRALTRAVALVNQSLGRSVRPKWYDSIDLMYSTEIYSILHCTVQ